MQTAREQQTIARPVALSGFGFWSGADVVVEFRPAEANTGIVFVRRDLAGAPRIPALVGHRQDVPRRTNLAVPYDGQEAETSCASVEMVEHLLAACYAQQVDNCEVWVDGAEMPGLDGSSQAFFDALDMAGRVGQAATRDVLVIREPVRVSDGRALIEAQPAMDGGLHLEYQLDYPNCGAIGRQQRRITVERSTFGGELASSRTFLLREEAERLRAAGLANRPTNKDVLVFTDVGPIDNELRFADECVRHKLLDLVGDLALAGCDVQGRLIAHQSGHHLNAELVRTLIGRRTGQQMLRKSA